MSNSARPLSKFKLWLQRIWFDYRQEHDEFHEPSLDIKEYFNTYKYWLKQKFREEYKEESHDSNFAAGIVLDDKLDYRTTSLLSDSQNKLLKKVNNEK
jgi:hypothetical protein